MADESHQIHIPLAENGTSYLQKLHNVEWEIAVTAIHLIILFYVPY
jgi:hypothetical protein